MIRVGDFVETRNHGYGFVRGISSTTPCLTSIDVEIINDDDKRVGWVVLPLSEIVYNEQ